MFGYDSLCEHGYHEAHDMPNEGSNWAWATTHCVGPRDEAGMTSDEALAFLREKLTGEPTATEKWGYSTLVVTFTDGEIIRYANVRYLMMRGYSDPIIPMPNGWLSFENDEGVITVAGVRSFVLDHMA